jgi:hypothetical protein
MQALVGRLTSRITITFRADQVLALALILRPRLAAQSRIVLTTTDNRW